MPETPVLDEALAFAIKLARATGDLLVGFYTRADIQFRYKQDHTLLTEADLAADRFISEQIQSAFPQDAILSEEMNTSFPADGRPTWIIDPLDGTTNFSQRIHYWGVSIARVVDGWPELAALYFPIINELYSARRGAGAALNGIAFTVPDEGTQPVAFFTCDSRVLKHYHSDIAYKPRILGSAAYNFCAVASGASIVGIESIPKVWDIAGSWLVLQEAGGACTTLKGQLFPLKPGMDYAGVKFPVLGAANPALLEKSKGQIHFR